MPDANFNPLTAVYTKTPEGQQEIQLRAMGLSPLVRRTLVLVDGQRTGADLAVFATGQDIAAIINELLDKGCVSARVVASGAFSISASCVPGMRWSFDPFPST